MKTSNKPLHGGLVGELTTNNGNIPLVDERPLSSESGHSAKPIELLLSAKSGRSTKILKQTKNGLSLIT